MALGDYHAGGGVSTGEWAQGAGGNWSGNGDWGAVSNPGNYAGTWGNGNLGGAMPNPWQFANLDPGAGVSAANASPLVYGSGPGYQVDPLTGRPYNAAGGPNYSYDIFAPGVLGGGYDTPAYNSGAMNTAGNGPGAVQSGSATPPPAAAPAPAPAAPAAPPPTPNYMQPGNPAAYANPPAWNLNLTDFSGGGGPLAPAPWQAPSGGNSQNWQPPAGLLGRV